MKKRQVKLLGEKKEVHFHWQLDNWPQYDLFLISNSPTVHLYLCDAKNVVDKAYDKILLSQLL